MRSSLSNHKSHTIPYKTIINCHQTNRSNHDKCLQKLFRNRPLINSHTLNAYKKMQSFVIFSRYFHYRYGKVFPRLFGLHTHRFSIGFLIKIYGNIGVCHRGESRVASVVLLFLLRFITKIMTLITFLNIADVSFCLMWICISHMHMTNKCLYEILLL